MPHASALDHRPPLRFLDPAQMRELAEECRAMAAVASSTKVRQALDALAVRYAMMARRREEKGAATRH